MFCNRCADYALPWVKCDECSKPMCYYCRDLYGLCSAKCAERAGVPKGVYGELAQVKIIRSNPKE